MRDPDRCDRRRCVSARSVPGLDAGRRQLGPADTAVCRSSRSGVRSGERTMGRCRRRNRRAGPTTHHAGYIEQRRIQCDPSELLPAALDQIAVAGPLTGRVEVPELTGHWEAYYVARRIPIARGWLRQTDTGRNDDVFYDQRPNAQSYQAFLQRTATQYVAVADAPATYYGRREIDLIDAGLPYLRKYGVPPIGACTPSTVQHQLSPRPASSWRKTPPTSPSMHPRERFYS